MDGFRRSHTQALRARGIAMAAGATGVVDADTPGLAAAALLGENLDEAKVFVRDTLGNLATDDASDARLRETLRVFLKHGCSYTAAADELTVHFNTVKYRVGRALQRRGRPLGDDRLDTELALLACQWFGTAVLD
ncbi:helix-turn-helix domain-containing protein [Mycolicibacterium sp. J2]|nr:helix-turn-helix domain-containing protein [Mycolicibacterium sp. J2]